MDCSTEKLVIEEDEQLDTPEYEYSYCSFVDKMGFKTRIAQAARVIEPVLIKKLFHMYISLAYGQRHKKLE